MWVSHVRARFPLVPHEISAVPSRASRVPRRIGSGSTECLRQLFADVRDRHGCATDCLRAIHTARRPVRRRGARHHHRGAAAARQFVLATRTITATYAALLRMDQCSVEKRQQ